MGIVHRATLTPSKQELVATWLPTQTWAEGLVVAEKVAEYRFDDPAGEVGVETILWRTTDGALLQVPLTYRAAPLPAAEEHLVTTAHHSVLGERWVYDGCGDPVWAATLVTAVLTGAEQSPMFFEDGGTRIDIPARMHVRGSGSEASGPPIDAVDSVIHSGVVTTLRAGSTEIELARVVDAPLGDGARLVGRVGDAPDETVLAVVRTA
ncbi:hypothetical protein SFC79_10005 [Nocardioides sp. S-58]|uniref:Maltokinase N-terminal cap domain-containing protein n=1 Tax=Nocardioides renjunii TaxID=3095075 RepID=A0ABU5KCF3_9ACTN|nr:hypothetical protein [Nocardioides sp. S-58]MDZ5662095.1 hypothetical protein [Nocardioides sp. S-58]